jgi:hypothetical protein
MRRFRDPRAFATAIALAVIVMTALRLVAPEAAGPSNLSPDSAVAGKPAPQAAPSRPGASTQRAAETSAPEVKTQSAPGAAPPVEEHRGQEHGGQEPGRQAAATTLDLPALEKRLRETKAIGLFTKLSLKNQVDDLLDRFREFHKGPGGATLRELRQSYDLLLLKVLSLLQDSDPSLARAIVASREALWGILTDPAKFATL